jgi:PmbA protein
MMERAYLEEKLGPVFEQFEVCLLKEGRRKYEVANRDLGGVEFRQEEGMALRAIKDHKMVFSYTFEKGEAAINSLLDNTKILLPFADRDEDFMFPEPFGEYPKIDGLYDAEGRMQSEDRKIGMLLDMEKTILDYDQRIKKTRNCELNEMEIEVTLLNSRGLFATAKKTLYALGGLAVAADEEEVSWYDWSWSHNLSAIDGKSLGLKIARKTISLLSPRPLKTGVYEGLLTPGAACEILAILSSSFLSESLEKNKTWLKDKVGQDCFSPLLTLSDSGFVGMESLPFDGEGVPSRRNVLVREGHFEGFLYDVYYGRKLGKPSTANSVRAGIKELPRCGARGLAIEPGREDIEGALTDGVIIEELMGTHTANPVTGDFSVGATGFFCRKGERIPLKGVMFSGNVFELLKNLRGIGEDLTFYGTFGSPSLLIEGLKISGE